ncbi:DUF2637 domain-containing protein [Streptomyces sp. 5.8]|uniref:DUF2637 domain-containing protein n=1 Tax=Streptomyces sp. 5.8 TaxID=3406571 RepID=UPI003BB75215
MTTTAGPDKSVAAGQPGRRQVVWTRGRRVVFGLIGFGSLLIALTGFIGSYAAVRNLAIEKGFGWFSTFFPLGIDIGIVVMLSLDLALTWIDLRYPLLRRIAWLLTIATVGFNAMAAYPDTLASIMHATIPLLFIAITEAVRHAVEAATAREAGREDYALSLGRWVLAPWSTWLIWRSRKLWPSTISSYEMALELYQEKLEYRQELRDTYGWRWRRRAGRDELRPLRRSRLGYAVRPAEEPASTSTSTRLEVPGLVLHAPRSEGGPPRGALSAHLETSSVRTPASSGAPFRPHGPGGSSAMAVRDPEAAFCPPAEGPPGGEAVVAEEELEVVVGASAADAAVGDVLGEGIDADVDENAEFDPEADGQVGSLPVVDVGDPPEGESKRARAERIYLAHQEAGVELTRRDLARWAGYKRVGSGRTAYVELERKFGPIEARGDEAGHPIHEQLTPAPA